MCIRDRSYAVENFDWEIIADKYLDEFKKDVYKRQVPKPLVEIKDNYTILDKQLFDFKNAGVNQVYLLTGFLSDKIQELSLIHI